MIAVFPKHKFIDDESSGSVYKAQVALIEDASHSLNINRPRRNLIHALDSLRASFHFYLKVKP